MVEGFNEMVNVGLSFLTGAILIERDLLAFQGVEKACGLRILGGMAHRSPADLGLHPGAPLSRGITGLLHPLIGMMNQAWANAAARQRHIQGIQSQRGITVARELPADTPPPIGI